MPQCSLCEGQEATLLEVGPRGDSVPVCATCRAGIEAGPVDAPHWQCLNEAIWSPEPAVQVLAWRLLKAMPEAPWARDLLDIAMLEADTLAWAEAGASGAATIVHRDTHGAVLSSGDTVTLIKDLPVKGAGFTAKRGTAVRNISLVPDNERQIEGRVEGQRIVILTEFVKKS
ncbi:alkylphosphonate utilization protein [Cereibacter sphaeroides]|uniref:alkylphosphonate utilization protein n=1 Tax=Cereibacter sphaeroides TaxID=1063 RepID=UPI001F18E488|nr:alkylphosphonate utilization protein [Cereibacter sphaeroides]MCE6951356.1 alkylphosphonate utilization protein [Cereibacter sphaeroides]MCE6970052.1 alkylphosphonate utilization protein [Cereibacter sphaeroides]